MPAGQKYAVDASDVVSEACLSEMSPRTPRRRSSAAVSHMSYHDPASSPHARRITPIPQHVLLMRTGGPAFGVIAVAGLVGIIVSTAAATGVREDHDVHIAMTATAAVASLMCFAMHRISRGDVPLPPSAPFAMCAEVIYGTAYVAVCVLGLIGYDVPAKAATEQLALTTGLCVVGSAALRGGVLFVTACSWAVAWYLRDGVFTADAGMTPCVVVLLTQAVAVVMGIAAPKGGLCWDTTLAEAKGGRVWDTQAAQETRSLGCSQVSEPLPKSPKQPKRAVSPSTIGVVRTSDQTITSSPLHRPTLIGGMRGNGYRPLPRHASSIGSLSPLHKKSASVVSISALRNDDSGRDLKRHSLQHSEANSSSYFIAPVPARFEPPNASDADAIPCAAAAAALASPGSQAVHGSISMASDVTQSLNFTKTEERLVPVLSGCSSERSNSLQSMEQTPSEGSALNFAPENHRVSLRSMEKLPMLPQPQSRWSFLVNNLNNVAMNSAARTAEENQKDIIETLELVQNVIDMTSVSRPASEPHTTPRPEYDQEPSVDTQITTSLLAQDPSACKPLVRSLQSAPHVTLERLLLLSIHLSEELDIFRINRFVCTSIVNILECERASIFLCDWSTNVLWTISEDGHHIRVAMNNSLAGYCATHAQTLNISDAYQDPRFNKDVDRDTGYVTRNLVVSPISRGLVDQDESPRGGRRVFAVVEAMNKKDGRVFTKQDEGLLALLGKHAGVHLLNAQVYQQLQVEGTKTTCLLEVSKDINDVQLKLGEMMAKIMTRARQVLTVERASIFLIDKAKQELWSILTDSETAAQLGGDNVIRFPVGVGLAGFVAMTGEVLNIDDAYNCELFNPEFDKKTGFKTKSTLCVPVKARNSAKIFGVIQFINKVSGEPFHEGDVDLATSFSSFVGVSLNNVVLFDELREGQLIREKNRELMRLRDQAKQAAEAKSNFLMAMSHEIRTPMTGVIGMCELLTSTPLSSEQREMTETIRSCGEALMAIINDVLDYGRLDAGKLTLEATPFMLVNLLEETVDVMRPKTESKNLTLLLDIDGRCAANLVGDQYRLRQVLTNLVGNAVKFTPEGGDIHLRVRPDDVTTPTGAGPGSGHPPDHVGLHFSVTDTGIGVDEKAQHRLFRPFEQADAGTTRQYGGSGLGLAICKQLVDAMDGQIGIMSKIDHGSTFWFTARFGMMGRDAGERVEEGVSPVKSPRGQRPTTGLSANGGGFGATRVSSCSDAHSVNASIINIDVLSPGMEPVPARCGGDVSPRRPSSIAAAGLSRVHSLGPRQSEMSVDPLTPTTAGVGGSVEQYLHYLSRGDGISRTVYLCCTHARHRGILLGVLRAVKATVWWIDDFTQLDDATWPNTLMPPPRERDRTVAVAAASRAPTPLPHLPDLVLVDCDSTNFMQADGLTRLKTLREKRSSVAVGLIMKINEKASLENKSAFDFICTKPVKLEAMIGMLIQRRALGELSTVVERTQPQQPQCHRRLLIAEDNPTNQLVINKQLTSFGVTPTICGNGQEAVDALLKERYDLVLMDCHMPVLDGYGATKRIRELEKAGGFIWKDPTDDPICVIALTADALPQTRDQCLDAGMDHYLTKPLKKQVLKQTLDTYFFV